VLRICWIRDGPAVQNFFQTFRATATPTFIGSVKMAAAVPCGGAGAATR
jgi:hypothetical protein